MPRYAVYCVPDGAFGDRGASWLGWDVRRGRPVHPNAAPDEWAATPRRYGFHATLKPPMRLADGYEASDLRAAVADLAACTAPASAQGLTVEALDGFVALRPEGAQDLDRVAAACVEGLDAFRAPPLPDETARRRATKLTAAQEAMLAQWGYPYVMEEFRFHLTLSGRVVDPDAVAAAARGHFGTLPAPFTLDAIVLCVEGDDGFRQVHRAPLAG